MTNQGDLSQLTLLSKIGKGSPGTWIYSAQHTTSKKIYAVKRIECSPSEIKILETECTNMKKVSFCSSICTVYGSYIRRVIRSDEPGETTYWHLVMDLYESDVGKRIKETKNLPNHRLSGIHGSLKQDERLIIRWIYELSEAIVAIHNLGLIHRDLTPNNMFLDAEDHLKIGDFGVSTDKTIAATTVGTAGYIAPELRSEIFSSYKPSADMYSIGCILLELLTLTTASEAEGKSIETRLKQLDDTPYSGDLKRIVVELLNKNPESRLTAIELRQKILMLRGSLSPPSPSKELKQSLISQSWRVPYAESHSTHTPLTIITFQDRLYISNSEQIRCYGSTGHLLGTYPGKCMLPWLRVCGGSNLILLAASEDRIYIWDDPYIYAVNENFDWIFKKWEPHSELGNFVVDKDHIYVGYLNGTICVYNRNFELKFHYPTGLPITLRSFIVQNDMIYMVNTKLNCVHKFNSSNGRQVEQWGEGGWDEGRFNSPTQIFGYEGLLFIGDAERVQIFDSKGQFYQRLHRGKNPRDLCYFKDRIYLLDPSKDHINVYGIEGMGVKPFEETQKVEDA